MRARPAEERFWEKVEMIPFHTCWEWTANLSRGYGKFGVNYKVIFAHRFSYELAKGKIPDGLVIDHLCKNRKCVNPNHLEAVTVRENNRRSPCLSTLNSKKTHCKNGHELIGNDVRFERGKHGISRRCKKCLRVAFKKKHRGTTCG